MASRFPECQRATDKFVSVDVILDFLCLSEER